jgi:hypothetical protein
MDTLKTDTTNKNYADWLKPSVNPYMQSKINCEN